MAGEGIKSAFPEKEGARGGYGSRGVTGQETKAYR